MRKILLAALFGIVLTAAPISTGFGQKKQGQCQQGAPAVRNWSVIGRDYVYFDYILCPADMNPPKPLVKVWITTRGNGISIEKWAQDRAGADSISMFNGKKNAYILYRDLNAVPLQVFKSEDRSTVPAGMVGQPFLAVGSNLIPLENLMPDSIERARKVFESADALIKQAERRVALLHETERIATIVNTLDKPLKAQK